MEGKGKGSIAIAVGIALLVVALFIALAVMHQRDSATRFDPSPLGDGESVPAGEDARFPKVDWEYWRFVNPDVCGWITVPGTDIDMPVVQAGADDPGFYLKHDVYGAWNIYGCAYVSWECEGGLLGSPVALVYGHHMDDGSMFAPVAGYLDIGFAESHRTILVQTPTERRELTLIAADRVNARTESAVLEFGNPAGYRAWLREMIGSCDSPYVPAADTEHVSGIVALCTCSYGIWSDERTVAYFAAKEGA